jgi:hypothetical protein
MQDTITRFLNAVSDVRQREALLKVLAPIGDRLSTQTLSSPGLAIKSGGSAIVKAGSQFHASIQGKLVRVAANTDQAALAGTVTNAKFNVFCFFLDVAGTGTSVMGGEASTIGGVQWPAIPQGKSLTGFVIINPTGTGNFVGGTTPLDDATVVPNAVYVNVLGSFDPSVLIS